MSIFLELAHQYAAADGAFAAMESQAFASDDDSAYDLALRQRARNDQAYFLYLFTRFENAVNEAVDVLLHVRCAAANLWSERRIWETMRRGKLGDVAFLVRVQILIDKSTVDYSYVRRLYDSRNRMGHGGDWEQSYDIPVVAMRLNALVGTFQISWSSARSRCNRALLQVFDFAALSATNRHPLRRKIL